MRTFPFSSIAGQLRPTILPGLISLALYPRRPSRLQVSLGLPGTVVLSALLGYVSPSGPLTQLGTVVVAIMVGVALYVGILAYLLYAYPPKRAQAPNAVRPTAPP